MAATGAITEDGEVLAVGQVKAKTRAAVEAGIDIVIVPTANYPDARTVTADTQTKVYGVPSLKRAVEVLCNLNPDSDETEVCQRVAALRPSRPGRR